MANEYELLDAVGRDCLILIQYHYQGRRLYIPKLMHREHPLARLIGLEAAKKLSDLYPSSLFTISRSLLLRERNSSIIRERRHGIPATDIARRHGLTARSVRNICQGELRNARRPHFFGMRARLQRAARQAGRGYGSGYQGEPHG